MDRVEGIRLMTIYHMHDKPSQFLGGNSMMSNIEKHMHITSNGACFHSYNPCRTAFMDSEALFVSPCSG